MSLSFKEQMLVALSDNNLDDYDEQELVAEIEEMTEAAYAANKNDRAKVLEKLVDWVLYDDLNKAGRQELKQLVEKYL